ncbi:hypothetical protein B0H15DRAFT_955235 [Mycena belliarum]|uniref:Uncharacterized protein n=1 Tax=Mycena belliarum TaxID=1033014 RepID=A0AAD6TSY6_9AGAR|nr:hypothetical protein B0H15DRAFT_955235 [Mycena belliae]
MSRSHLDQIWLRYTTSRDPLSGVDTLYQTCSALTKHVLLPSHIIPHGGGFVLHPYVAEPLAQAIPAMDHLLYLAARYHRLRDAPCIGRAELQTLTATTGLHACATIGQIVHHWVIVIDRLWAAMQEMKALCLGNPFDHSRQAWNSKIPLIASSLPIALRARLPNDLLDCFKISTTSLSDRAASIARKTSLAPMDCVDHGNNPHWSRGPYALKAQFALSVDSTVREMQRELTNTFSLAPNRPACFVIDPGGQLLQTLGGASCIAELSVAWAAPSQRMGLAQVRLEQYQSERRAKAIESELTRQMRSLHGGLIVRDGPREASPALPLPTRITINPRARASSRAQSDVSVTSRRTGRYDTPGEPLPAGASPHSLPRLVPSSPSSSGTANKLGVSEQLHLPICPSRRAPAPALVVDESSVGRRRRLYPANSSRIAPVSSALVTGETTPGRPPPNTAASHPHMLPARLRVPLPLPSSGRARYTVHTNGRSAVARVAPPPKSPAPAPATADAVELGGLRVEVTQTRATASASMVERGGLASVPLGMNGADAERDEWQAAEASLARPFLTAKSSARRLLQERTSRDVLERGGPAPLPIGDTVANKQDAASRGTDIRTPLEDSSASSEECTQSRTTPPASSLSPPAAPTLDCDEGAVALERQTCSPAEKAQLSAPLRIGILRTVVRASPMHFTSSPRPLAASFRSASASGSVALVSAILRTSSILRLACTRREDRAPLSVWEREGIGTCRRT